MNPRTGLREKITVLTGGDSRPYCSGEFLTADPVDDHIAKDHLNESATEVIPRAIEKEVVPIAMSD